MKLFTIISCFLFVVATSCGKDKFKTQPQIEIKSINHKTVAPDETLSIRLKFTDKEGDIGNGYFVYIPVRQNQHPLPNIIPNYDSVKLSVPDFSNETQGEYVLNLPWINLHKSDTENDSIIMRFVAIDRGNNKSDTVNTAQIVIFKD